MKQVDEYGDEALSAFYSLMGCRLDQTIDYLEGPTPTEALRNMLYAYWVEGIEDYSHNDLVQLVADQWANGVKGLDQWTRDELIRNLVDAYIDVIEDSE